MHCRYVFYVMIQIYQIRERPNGDEVIQQTQNTSTTSGTATKLIRQSHMEMLSGNI